jgi:hypothetical protein
MGFWLGEFLILSHFDFSSPGLNLQESFLTARFGTQDDSSKTNSFFIRPDSEDSSKLQKECLHPRAPTVDYLSLCIVVRTEKDQSARGALQIGLVCPFKVHFVAENGKCVPDAESRKGCLLVGRPEKTKTSVPASWREVKGGSESVCVETESE